jgi:hypothetical protein
VRYSERAGCPATEDEVAAKDEVAAVLATEDGMLKRGVAWVGDGDEVE